MTILEVNVGKKGQKNGWQKNRWQETPFFIFLPPIFLSSIFVSILRDPRRSLLLAGNARAGKRDLGRKQLIFANRAVG